MSNSVDNRVVEMQFNNSSFENKISGTLSSLSKLKDALSFGGKGKNGFDDINSSANAVNLSGIASAVDNVSSKFSAMGVVAFTVISNITNRAIDAGAKVVKAFALDPVMDGFREYETNINSIQTILANTKSKGSTLDDVNGALDKLNQYADQTIYNFSEMARNIGTFTAAGVDLDTSVNAIKGIANLAALSGSNSQQASTAMYQLSQALAAGKVNLMDWNSVVNAGMGGELFKKALFETGKAMKTITDVPVGASFEEWEKKGGSFREQMEKGWLTADVLKTTLSAMSGDLDQSALMAKGFSAEAARGLVDLGKQGAAAATEIKTFTQLIGTVKESVGSGWATSFKIIIGNFEEAKALWTSVGSAVGKFADGMSDARNNLLQGWKDLGGRQALIEGLGNAFGVIGSILDRVGKAFREVFPAKTAGDLYSMTTAFRDFFAKLQPSAETLNQLKAIFKGFFSALAIGKEIISNVAQTFEVFFSNLARANGGGGGKFLQFLAEFAYKITHLKDVLVDGGGIQDFFNKYIFPIANKLGSLNFVGPLETIAGAIKKFGTAVKEFFSMPEIAGKSEEITSAVDRVGERFGWLATVGEKLGNLGQWLASKLSNIGDVFKDMLKKIAEVFSGTDTDAVFDALNAGLLAGIVALLAKFMKDGFKLDFGGGFMENMSGALEQLTGTLDAMQKNLKAEALMKLAIAIGIITASVLVLSLIDSGALTKAMIGLAVGFGILIGAMALLGKATDSLGSIKMMAMATGLILLAGAMLILSLAVKVMASMDVGEMAKGLIGIGIMLGMLTLAVNNMPDEGKMLASSVGILAMSAALVVMSIAVAIMGSMELSTMIQGLVGVGVALAMLVIAVNAMPDEGKMLSAAVGMIAMGVALNIIAAAIAILGTMELSTLIQGMIAIAVALAILVIAVNSFPDEGRLLATAAAMVIMGVALNIIAGAIAILGNMGLGDLIQGLVGLAAALLIIVIAMAAMSGVLAGAAGMIIAAGAIAILAAALKVLGGMSVGELIMALVAVAAGLAVITVAALLIQPALPAILGLGAALVVLGIGGALFGVAALLIVTAVGMLVAALGELVEIGLEGAKVLAEVFPVLAVAVGDAIVTIATKIAEGLPGIIAALSLAVTALLQLLIDNIPKFGEVISTLIATILQVIRDAVPDIIATGMLIILSLLEGVSSNIEEITNKGIDIITKFLNALTARIGEVIDAGMGLITAIITGIGARIGEVTDAAGDLIVSLLNGISQNMQKVTTAGADLIISVLNGMGSNMNRVVTAGVDMILAVMSGISSNIQRLVDTGFQIMIAFLNGLADSIEKNAPQVRAAGWRVARAIIDGVTDGFGELGRIAVDAVKNLGGKMLDGIKGIFGIRSPSRVMFQMAGYIAQGLANGLDQDSSAANSAGSFADNVVSTLNGALSQVMTSVENMAEFNPTITPVIDMSNIEAGAARMSGLLTPPSIDAGMSLGLASSIASTTQDASTQDTSGSKDSNVNLTFEQTIIAPTALNQSDIYRQTKSQFSMAKEELANAGNQY